MIGAAVNTLRVPSPQTAQNGIISAPIMGMNAAMNITDEDQRVCLWANNMIPNEYGMRVRYGYREWAVGFNDAELRTIIVYYGRPLASTEDRIFAATTDGIYDCTDFDTTPVLVQAFSTNDSESGHGMWINYVTEAGEDLIFYADEANGLFTYTASTDSWAQTSGITEAGGSSGVFDATEIVFIVSHKLRLWLIPKDSNKAWYLPVRAIAGTATEFFFAQKFRHGGELVGLYNWTVDGGYGRDDHLVAIGRGGDVIPWTGEDPSDAMTWTSTGVFHIGPIPKGRRIAAENGGELFMLSSFGVTTLSDLMKAGSPLDPFRNQIGYRIARFLRDDVAQYKNNWGWELSFLTDQGLLLITAPERTDGTHRQYSYTLATSGWGLWTSVPMHCSYMYDGHLMIGTSDGRICRMDVNSDNISLDESTRTAIKWAVLSSYSTLGAPALFKRLKLIRPNFVAETRPTYEAQAYYDYRFDGPPATSLLAQQSGDVWDTGVWGTAAWSGSTPLPFHKPLGTTGIGRAVAIAMSGASYNETFLASWDILWDTGGFL